MSLTFDEVCWACQQVAKFYPEPVPMSALSEVAGTDIGLCDRHWSWWVAYWMGSEFSPGCRSHLIGAVPNRENGSES
jgi:hypothetical protein